MAPSQGFAPHDAKVRIRNVQARLMQVYSGPVGPGLEQALGTLQNAMDIWFRSGYSEHMVFLLWVRHLSNATLATLAKRWRRPA